MRRAAVMFGAASGKTLSRCIGLGINTCPSGDSIWTLLFLIPSIISSCGTKASNVPFNTKYELNQRRSESDRDPFVPNRRAAPVGRSVASPVASASVAFFESTYLLHTRVCRPDPRYVGIILKSEMILFASLRMSHMPSTINVLYTPEAPPSVDSSAASNSKVKSNSFTYFVRRSRNMQPLELFGQSFPLGIWLNTKP